LVFHADKPDRKAGVNDRGGNIQQLVTDQDGDGQSAGFARQMLYQTDAWIVITTHLPVEQAVEGVQADFGAGDSQGGRCLLWLLVTGTFSCL
jgi:hypothetical protein